MFNHFDHCTTVADEFGQKLIEKHVNMFFLLVTSFFVKVFEWGHQTRNDCVWERRTDGVGHFKRWKSFPVKKISEEAKSDRQPQLVWEKILTLLASVKTACIYFTSAFRKLKFILVHDTKMDREVRQKIHSTLINIELGHTWAGGWRRVDRGTNFCQIFIILTQSNFFDWDLQFHKLHWYKEYFLNFCFNTKICLN